MGFFHKKIAKNDTRGQCFERMDLILTIYRHESYLFFTEWTVFLTIYRHESIDFFVKNREKKGILLNLLAHNKVYFWQNWRFLTNYMHAGRGFSWEIWKKMTLEQCFWEKRRFFDKIWAWELSVFQRLDVFLTEYGQERSDFFVKSREKKCILLTWPIIYQSFNRMGFFWSIMGMTTGGFFMKKMKKISWEHKSKVARTGWN